MAASDFTEADLTAVRTAMLRGERTVQYETRAVTYHSMSDLIALEQRIIRVLRSINGSPKQTVAVSSGKGF